MPLVSILASALDPHRLVDVGLTVGLIVGLSTVSVESAAQQNSASVDGAAAANVQNPEPSAKAAESSAPATVDECLSAHRDGQTLRKQLNLIESRALFNLCSNAVCPAPVTRDCLRWTDEITAQVPSVVFRVESAENEASRKVKIYVENELRFQVVPNRAVELNPGTYRFRFEAEGKPPVEQEVTLGDAEKFRVVAIKFAADAQSAASAGPRQIAPAVATSTNPNQDKVESRPIPVASYVFAGIGAAAMINFAAWGLSSKSLVSDLQNRCAPDCEQTYIDRARFRATVADISLGVGAASFVTAGVIYFLRPSTYTPVEVNVGVLPHGGVMGSMRMIAF